MNKKLLEILVCPVEKSPLVYDEANQELISHSSQLAYPILNGIAVMLQSKARKLTPKEADTNSATNQTVL